MDRGQSEFAAPEIASLFGDFLAWISTFTTCLD